MYKVYILKSIIEPSKSYVGLTIKKVDERLKEHNLGLSPYSKTYLPWEVVYYENFYCKLCAEKREQFLKSGFGYKLRKLILDNYKTLARE